MTSPRDVVLTIGVNHLPNLRRLPPLKYAEDDALALARTFRRLGIPGDRVTTLTGPAATFENIGRQLARLPADYPDLGPLDRIWFCFSGHGITGEDGVTHLLVHDTAGDPRKAPERSVTVEQVANVLCDAPADRVLLLDACRSEARAQAKSGLRAPAAGLDSLDLLKYPGLAIFSGCTEGSYSFEDPRRQLGLFTAALIDIFSDAERPLSVADLDARLLGTVPARSMQLGPRHYQQPSLRIEPYWRADGMLLFPHLLRRDDVMLLRSRAAKAPAATAAALWQTMRLLNPDDSEARRLCAHFAAMSAAHSQRTGGSGSRLPLDKLDDLLRGREWLAADRETAGLLMSAAGRDPERTGNPAISLDEMSGLRRADLAALDELWMRHSDGRFGFTPQLRRLHTAQGDVGLFADLIGWRRKRWISYAEAQWRSGAPVGHLPVVGPIGGIKPWWPMSYARQGATGLSSVGVVPYRAVRYSRNADAVERATADIAIDDAFGWKQYNELAMITMGDVYLSLARGSVKPLAAALNEAPGWRLARNYTSLLSVAWAASRVRLLRHYEAITQGESHE